MRVVVAPDSFKESLSAVAVAAAMARGVRDARPDAEVDVCPMADGGEGTVEAMVAATGGRLVPVDTFGPLLEPRQARFGVLGDGRTGVIEMADAAGLALLPPARRDPTKTTTYGVGWLIRAALEAGLGRIVVGIGGSATVDGGAGSAQALGVVFLDRAGRRLARGLSGGQLGRIGRIDVSGRHRRLSAGERGEGADVRVACDVSNPLTGPDGAAAVYGPQKGATPGMVELLEAGLANLAGAIRRDLGVDVTNLPGGGAAGGLGAGLVAFAGARLESGVRTVAETVRLAERVRGADWVITGEGKFDSQSAAGKTAFGVAEIAAAAGVPAISAPPHGRGHPKPQGAIERSAGRTRETRLNLPQRPSGG